MRRFERVTTADPAVISYLQEHKARLGDEPPIAVFVAKDDEEVIAALLVWARAFLAVSFIFPKAVEEEAHRPFMVFLRLVGEFERWAVSIGARAFTFSVHQSEERYLRAIRESRFAEQLEHAPLASERGYVTFVRTLMEPLPKEHY